MKTNKRIIIRLWLKLAIPIFGVCLTIYLSGLIISQMPDVRYRASIVDIFGFTPSFLVVLFAAVVYLWGSSKDMIPKIAKLSLFITFVGLSTYSLENKVLINGALNFNYPMLVLLGLFTFWNAVFPFPGCEGHTVRLALITKENSIKHIFATVFTIVGFPLLLMDSIPAFLYFESGVVGGAGLRDGLNLMLITLILYSLVLYGTNKLANKIEK
ncbi:MAG: hypothetical protein NC925_03360 [Candidatus Omnitrophica bacterium]|nr:hypothetical protein [Candidatus Omnitrophota bacterium]